MKKIPTLFRRDPDDMRHVLPEVTPGCEWVLAGEGVATRKYDGTCLLMDGQGDWWARREVKPGEEPPPVFVEVDHDPVTDKRVGWEPVEQTGWLKYIAEAIAHHGESVDQHSEALLVAGTYELCGPKVNRNPEGYEKHTLVRHVDAERGIPATLSGPPLTVQQAFSYLRAVVLDYGKLGREGIVWHHPDGRMVKLKARDFQ